MKRQSKRLRTRALTDGAIMLALAVVLNYLSHMIFASMPQGGSITLAMFPILFYAHRWGVGRGALMGFAYGLVDMLIDMPNVLSIDDANNKSASSSENRAYCAGNNRPRKLLQKFDHSLSSLFL